MEILEKLPESLGSLLSGLSIPKTCLICGDINPHVLGIFNPFDSQLYGAKKGKSRIVFYALCKKCSQKTNITEIVEKTILYDVTKTKQ